MLLPAKHQSRPHGAAVLVAHSRSYVADMCHTVIEAMLVGHRARVGLDRWRRRGAAVSFLSRIDSSRAEGHLDVWTRAEGFDVKGSFLEDELEGSYWEAAVIDRQSAARLAVGAVESYICDVLY